MGLWLIAHVKMDAFIRFSFAPFAIFFQTQVQFIRNAENFVGIFLH